MSIPEVKCHMMVVCSSKDPVRTFDPIFFSMSRTRTFCWMYMSSGDFPGASSRFIPPAPVALRTQTNPRYTRPVKNCSYTNTFTGLFLPHNLNAVKLIV